MLFFDLMGWWYLHGWSWLFESIFKRRNGNILETFSTGKLFKTLFSPYRQTFAGRVRGGIGDKLRGVVDQTISRVIGFIVRLALIAVSLLLVIFNSVLGLAFAIIWPVVPALPLIGVVLLLAEVSNAV